MSFQTLLIWHTAFAYCVAGKYAFSDMGPACFSFLSHEESTSWCLRCCAATYSLTIGLQAKISGLYIKYKFRIMKISFTSLKVNTFSLKVNVLWANFIDTGACVRPKYSLIQITCIKQDLFFYKSGLITTQQTRMINGIKCLIITILSPLIHEIC